MVIGLFMPWPKAPEARSEAAMATVASWKRMIRFSCGSLERVAGRDGLGGRLVVAAAREGCDRDHGREQNENDGDGAPEPLAETRGFDRCDIVLGISVRHAGSPW